MAWLRSGICLYLLSVSLGEDCVLDHSNLETAFEFKLKTDLKCNYHAQKPPTKSYNDTTAVTFRYGADYVGFDDTEEIFIMHTTFYLYWYDYRLKWNPNDYDGLDYIIIPSSTLWRPAFTLLNTGYGDSTYYLDQTSDCRVESDGQVFCLYTTPFYVKCSSKLSDWPYDTQRCQLQFGDGWYRVGTNTIYSFDGTRMGAWGDLVFGAGWDIINIDQNEIRNGNVQLTLIFDVKRQAETLTPIVLIPSIVVCLLTVSSLLLDARDSLRLGMICFSLLIHYCLLSEINEYLPKHSVDTPTLLLFVRGSTILTVISVIMTCVLTYLMKRVAPLHAYICSVNEFVYKSHAKYLIWPRWEASIAEAKISEELSEESTESWTYFASVVNSVCLLVIVIVYVTMFGVYIPKPNHVSPLES